MTNFKKVRMFNSAGLEKVSEIIIKKEKFNDSILFDEIYSEPYLDIQIDLDKTFNRRSEMSEYLFNTLNPQIDTNNQESGFWTWLLFAYFKFYVQHDAQGNPNPTTFLPRYVLTKKGLTSDILYRHMVFAFYKAFEDFGKRSAIFDGVDGTKPHTYPDVAEQFLSRKRLHTFFDIFYDIFFDKTKKCLKDGVSTSFRSNKSWQSQLISGTDKYSGYGGFIRWIKKMEQYSRIYRFHGMNKAKIKKVFSPEF